MMTLLLGALLGLLGHNQYSYADCKKLEFKPKACVFSKAVNDVAEKTKKK